jgi:hypothetical protein
MSHGFVEASRQLNYVVESPCKKQVLQIISHNVYSLCAYMVQKDPPVQQAVVLEAPHEAVLDALQFHSFMVSKVIESVPGDATAFS